MKTAPLIESLAAHSTSRILWQAATILATISIFIAPFRSSAGVRAGALVLALCLLGIVWFLTQQRTIVLPLNRWLRFSIVIWVLTVFAYALTSTDRQESLSSMRAGVLTPVLAALVFYSLCVSMRSLGLWLIALFVGLQILTGMVIIDPFQIDGGKHRPAYISIGWLTTWLVMMAALLPLAWIVPWPKPRIAKTIAVIAATAILIAGWLTANRMIWLCFGAMFVVYCAIHFRRPDQKTIHYLGILLLGAVASVTLFYMSSTVRVTYYPEASESAVSMLKRDDRPMIWRESIALIAEKPIVGHGYGLEDGKRALAARFEDPWHREVFRHGHNIVLNYAIQMGIPGALSLLCLFSGLCVAFWSRCRHQPYPMRRAAAACGLMLISGFFLRNMTDDFFSRHGALMFAALCGILLAIADGRLHVEDNASSPRKL